MIGALKSSCQLGAELEDFEAVLLRVHAVSKKLSCCLSKTWSWRITGRSFFLEVFLEEFCWWKELRVWRSLCFCGAEFLLGGEHCHHHAWCRFYFCHGLFLHLKLSLPLCCYSWIYSFLLSTSLLMVAIAGFILSLQLSYLSPPHLLLWLLFLDW